MAQRVTEAERLYFDAQDLERELEETFEALADKEAECSMLRALLARQGEDARRYVDTLERILDDWAYYTGRGQPVPVLDIQAQVELLAADMRKGV